MARLRFNPAGKKQIQIDWDRTLFSQENLKLWLKFGKVWAGVSKSGNLHITIKLHDNLGLKQRIMLAAALGDDPVRSRLNMMRARAGDPHPVLFLEKGDE